MKKFILFLSILMGGSLWGSNDLADYFSSDYKKRALLDLKLMQDTKDIDDLSYQDFYQDEVKRALTHSLEIAKKNDTEYFFKNYIDFKMSNILSNIAKFNVEQRKKIKKLEYKINNLKQFSEQYYSFQESLISIHTDIKALYMVIPCINLYKTLQDDLSSEISKYYDMVNSKDEDKKEETESENSIDN